MRIRIRKGRIEFWREKKPLGWNVWTFYFKKREKIYGYWISIPKIRNGHKIFENTKFIYKENPFPDNPEVKATLGVKLKKEDDISRR